MRQKARDFFAILQIIFVDNLPPIFEKIRTGVWILGAGGVKFQSPEYLF